MEPVSNDEKVVQLLSKLKDSDGGYPGDMLASRRQNYLKQVANVGMGIGIGAGIKHAAKTGNGAGTTATITSKILETALVAAIAVEASTAAYLYRDKISDFVKTYTNSSSVQAAPPTATDKSLANPDVAEVVLTPSITTLVTTPSGTPSPELAGDNTSNNNNTNLGANSTPNPGGNNGNHFGQTPKPVRTKENNNNTDTGGGGGNKTQP